MGMPMREAVVVAYGRSAIGKAFKGTLRDCHPVEFAGQVLTNVLKKVPQVSLEQIDDVVIGCARPVGKQTSNIGRIISLRAGIPVSVPAQTVTRLCASGLQSIVTAAHSIISGQNEIVIAGGVESMTYITMGTPEEDRCGWIEEHYHGVYLPMWETAENVARKYGISREEMESFACESHCRAAAAQAAGKFQNEIVPVKVPGEDGGIIVFDKDECIRPETNMEILSRLKPLHEGGSVTAGTSSPLNDGAAMLVLMSGGKANQLRLSPVARVAGFAVAGAAPEIMGIGPIYAVPKVLKQTGLRMEDMDVIELNEAFAAQAIPCIHELGMDEKKVNPNGGAIALGHPLGATGSIMASKAFSELRRTGGRYAMIAMCIGGGMGAAGIFEML